LTEKNSFFNPSKRILIIKQRGIGDVILSTPTLRTIRKYFEQAKISLVLDTPSVELFLNDPYIDEVIEIRRGIWNILTVIGKVKGKYSIVFDLISTPFSLILGFLSGAKIRVGWAKPKRFRGRFYTHSVDISKSIPAVDSNLRAVRHLGMKPVTEKVMISLSDREKDEVWKKWFDELSLENKELIVTIHPGNLFETKQWFPERFALLADLLTDSGYQVVITGSKDEVETVKKVQKLSNRKLCVLPPVSLREFACFLSTVDLVITNDGGVLYLSQAVGTKTFAIFGSTDPYIWFPYRTPDNGDYIYSNLECSPCAKKRCDSLECLRKIEVEDVFKKIKILLSYAIV